LILIKDKKNAPQGFAAHFTINQTTNLL